MKKLLMALLVGLGMIFLPVTAKAATTQETYALWQQTQAQVMALQGIISQFDGVVLTDPNQIAALDSIKQQQAALQQQADVLGQQLAGQASDVTNIIPQTAAATTSASAVAASAVATAPVTSAGGYIGNKNTKKFHYSSCSSVGRMSEKNKVTLATRDAAINAGYSPCQVCHP